MLNVSQIILLIITHNYYLYLIVMIVASILENIYVAIVVNKTYPQVLDKNARALSSNMKNDIRKKLKGLIYHKIGAYVVFGTDSILIAIFLGVKTVGLYGNYNLVIGALGSIVSQAFNGITGSVGNLLVTSVNRESFIVYKRLHFFNYWMSTIVSIGFLVCIDSFISLWIGKEFILSFGVVMAISINLYLQLNRSAVSVFKDAAGIFHEDRFVPVIESVVNLALCIFFLHLFGLVGVIMGTICSTLILYLFSYPRYLYVDLLSGKYWDYYKEFIKSIIITFLAGTLTYVLARQVHNTNAFLELVLNITVALIVPNTILYALLRKTDEFVYYKRMLLKYLKKILPHSRSI